MPRPPRKSFVGAKYHIGVRGNGRQDIFLSDEDRERFLEQLAESLERDGVVLYAYVLMTNHYHLLVETPRGNVSGFMQRLNTAYGMYFRYRHRRPGHVLQGRFKGKLVEGDEYLLRLTRYLHLNPIKIQRMKKVSEEERLEKLRSYRWSSYRGYVDLKQREPTVNYRWRASVGGRSEAENRRRYRRYVEGFVVRDDEDLRAILDRSGYAVGDEEFVSKVERELNEERGRRGIEHDVAWPAEPEVSLEAVDAAICRVMGCGADLLRKHGHVAGLAKSVAIEVACRLSGKRQRAVGQHYGGLSGAAVTRQRRKLTAQMLSDKDTRQKLDAALRAATREMQWVRFEPNHRIVPNRYGESTTKSTKPRKTERICTEGRKGKAEEIEFRNSRRAQRIKVRR